MSRRDDCALLHDIIDAANSAISPLSSTRREDLVRDKLRLLGIVKCLEIIGEAATQTSADLRARHPEVKWHAMIGMRNRLVHAYFEIDTDQVWQTLTEDLPILINAVGEIIKRECVNKQ